MIRLEMTVHQGRAEMVFELPEHENESVRLDELATFALHLDVVKYRIVALTNAAMIKDEGYEAGADK